MGSEMCIRDSSVYVSAAQVPEAPLLNVGDAIAVYWKSGTQWITAQKIEVENRAIAAPLEEKTGAVEPGTDSTIVSDEISGQTQMDTQGKV